MIDIKQNNQGNKKYYAVKSHPNKIYDNWNDCEKQIKGEKNIKYKSFKLLEEANLWLHGTQIPEIKLRQNGVVFQNKSLYIFTDGSCHQNGSPLSIASSAIFFEKDDPRNQCVLLERGSSINEAELIAFSMALEFVCSSKQQDFVICTDSSYVNNAYKNWMHQWQKNGWVKGDKREILNLSHIQNIFRLYKEVKAQDKKVDIVKVVAHTNEKDYLSQGNDGADKLAQGAVKMLRKLL